MEAFMGKFNKKRQGDTTCSKISKRQLFIHLHITSSTGVKTVSGLSTYLICFSMINLPIEEFNYHFQVKEHGYSRTFTLNLLTYYHYFIMKLNNVVNYER